MHIEVRIESTSEPDTDGLRDYQVAYTIEIDGQTGMHMEPFGRFRSDVVETAAHERIESINDQLGLFVGEAKRLAQLRS